jgi:hypothetical protein
MESILSFKQNYNKLRLNLYADTDIQIISCTNHTLPVACIIEMEDVRGECKYHLTSRAHAKMYILASRGENYKNCRHL